METSSTSSTSRTPSREDAVSSTDRRRPAAGSKRVLILYVRAGAGHERAARAVASAMEQLDPGAEPILQDALAYSSPLLRMFYASTYNRMVARAPRVWGFVYRRSEGAPIEGFRQALRTRVTLWHCRGYLEAVERLRPAAVLCTQFLPAEVYAFLRERGRLRIPVATVITDYSIHPIWVYRGMDRYYVGAEAVREQLVDSGVVPPERVEVTGVPVDPRFGIPIPRDEARRALGLDPDPARPVVLLMGGGFGWGPIEDMLQVVMQFPERVQALVVAGRNERLRERLAARARGQERRIQIHGFTDRVDLFLAASDVLVSKSGGLTCSEAMARGVPMIVVRPIPGQEERNCDFLQESGAALRARDLDELHYRLRHLLENPDDLAQMRARATAVGRPRSAHAVASAVLRLAGSFIP